MPVKLTNANLFPHQFYFLPAKQNIFEFHKQSIIKTGSLIISRTLSREIHDPNPHPQPTQKNALHTQYLSFFPFGKNFKAKSKICRTR